RCAVSETVEFGGWRPPPPWVWLIAGVAAVAVLAGGGTPPPRAPKPPSFAPCEPPPPGPPPPRRARGPGGGGGGPGAPGGGARGPGAVGACGSPAYLPRIHLAPYTSAAHPTVLVGGVALREITLGHPASGPLPGLRNQGLVVTKLVAGPGAAYAFVDPRCSGYLWVYRIVAGVASLLDTPA